MKKLFVTLLMVLMMVTSVSAKTRYSRSANAKYCWFVEDSTLGVTNNWYYIKQNQENIRKYIYELRYNNYNRDEEADLIKNIISSYEDRQACINWAEEHFKPRGGYKLTLSPEESEYFIEWFTRSAKQYNENLHTYQHWLSMTENK